MLLSETGGLKVPLPENPACWPLAQGYRLLPKGEPLDMRWNKTDCEVNSLPSYGKIEEGLMKTLVYKQIEDELVAGSMVAANWDNSTSQIQLLTTALLPKLSDIKVLLMESSSSEFLREFDVRSPHRNIPVWSWMAVGHWSRGKYFTREVFNRRVFTIQVDLESTHILSNQCKFVSTSKEIVSCHI